MLCSRSPKNEVFTATIDQIIRSDVKQLIMPSADDKPAKARGQ
jgi:hypothetical protein